jgi:hypothetical protein
VVTYFSRHVVGCWMSNVLRMWGNRKAIELRVNRYERKAN